MNKLITLLLGLCALVMTANAQWEKVNDPKLVSGFGISTMYYDNAILWAGGTGQIFKSADGGNTWTDVSTGLQSGISGCTGIVKLGNRHYASFSGNGDHNVYYSENLGNTWNIDTAGWSNDGGALYATIRLITYKDYVLAQLESNYIVYKKNTDPKWTILSVPNAFRTPGFMYSVGDTLILGAGNIAMTTDMGLNWTIRNTTYPPGTPLGFHNKVYQDRANPAVLFSNYQVLATSKTVLFVTHDNQMTWDSIHMDLDNQVAVSSMWIDGQNIYAAYVGSFQANDTTKKAFRSSNGGQTWSNITGNLYSLSQFKFHSLTSMQLVNGTLFAGGFSSAGIVKYATGSSGLNQLSASEQLTFYPNPASQFIYIDTDIETLVITDLNGKAVLESSNAGEIDIRPLAPGLYFIKAQKNDQVFVSKLMKE
jgi:photosystem II stability/assembly factor-like uncharacterized protein